MADREVGLFLSGGVDSRALAAASEGGGLRSFTVTFSESARDEGALAREQALRFGLRHDEVPVSGSELAAEIDGVARAMDQPTSDGVNSWIVSRAASQAGLVVALSGLGGDELFGGYPTFATVPRVAKSLGALAVVPRRARRGISASAALRYPGGRLSRLMASANGMGAAYRAVRSLFSPQDLDRLGASQWLGAGDVDILFTPAEPPHGDVADRIAFLEMTGYMRNQLLRDTDQMSMAHSVEVRVPLLDDRVVDTALAIPARIRNKPRKELLQRAAGITTTDPKRGFTLPFDRWMRGPLHDWTQEAVVSDRLPFDWLFERSGRERLWSAFEDGRVHWSRPWAIAILRAWADANELRW
jgi:asparagine synthase (glutamine-hydrolysing)